MHKMDWSKKIRKKGKSAFSLQINNKQNFKTLGHRGNVNKYKSHKPRFYSQENIKNVSNVKTETFYYSIIFLAATHLKTGAKGRHG